jgi:hypothetical protein
MNNVKLTIGDKEYSKLAPTIEDWLFNLDISPKIEGKNLIADPVAAKAAVDVVAEYLHIPGDEMDKADLLETLEAYHTIQKNIVKAFIKAQEVWGKNVDAPAS